MTEEGERARKTKKLDKDVGDLSSEIKKTVKEIDSKKKE